MTKNEKEIKQMKKLIIALAVVTALTTGTIPSYAENRTTEDHGPNYREEHIQLMQASIQDRLTETQKMQIAYDLPDEVIQHAESYSTTSIEIWETDDLTLDEIVTRQDRDALVIERLVGVVLNDAGDGRVLNTADQYYNYISYRSVPGARPGDIVVTYCFYNPENDVEDDIIERYDTIICNAYDALV